MTPYRIVGHLGSIRVERLLLQDILLGLRGTSDVNMVPIDIEIGMHKHTFYVPNIDY